MDLHDEQKENILKERYYESLNGKDYAKGMDFILPSLVWFDPDCPRPWIWNPGNCWHIEKFAKLFEKSFWRCMEAKNNGLFFIKQNKSNFRNGWIFQKMIPNHKTFFVHFRFWSVIFEFDRFLIIFIKIQFSFFSLVFSEGSLKFLNCTSTFERFGRGN